MSELVARRYKHGVDVVSKDEQVPSLSVQELSVQELSVEELSVEEPSVGELIVEERRWRVSSVRDVFRRLADRRHSDEPPVARPEPNLDEGWDVIDGPTAAGGVVTEVYYYGEDGRPCSIDRASRCVWRELDEADRIVLEGWYFLEHTGDGAVPPQVASVIYQERSVDVRPLVALPDWED